MLAVLENLIVARNEPLTTILALYATPLTFFRTLDETLGRGMGWSDSPTSALIRVRSENARMIMLAPTFEHVLDQHAALDNVFVGGELFIIRGDEKDHFERLRRC